MFNQILKKSIALISAVCCIFACFAGITPVSAESSILTDKMILDLKAFEILSGMEDGELHLEREFTRAQMCRVVAKMMQVDNGSYASSSYSDVPETHWAYQYISMLSSLGLLGGYPDGSFLPDNTVKYQEAAKILVSMLGYGLEAQNSGGYPDGYMSVASRVGILQGVGAALDTALTREQAMRMIYNCLDARRLVSQIVAGNDISLEVAEDTFRDLLLGDDEEGLMKIEGVVTATREFFLNSEIPDMEETQVEIDGVLYNCDNIDIANYFGMTVNAYVKANPNGSIDTVIEFEPSSDNKVLELDIGDIETLTNDEVVYMESGNKRKTYQMAIDVQFLYNGRQISGNDVSRLGVENMENAVVKFIGNTDDNEYNVVMIDEYESFLVDRASSADNRIYLAENQRFNNYRYIDTDEESNDIVVNIYDKDGNRITIDDIAEDSILSVIASRDGSLIRGYTGGEELEGTISGISPEDGEMIIDGQAYGYETTVDTTDILGQSALIKLNWRGEAAYIDTEAVGGTYGAIVAATRNEEEDNLKLRIVIPGKIKDEVEEVESDDPNDTDIPAIAAQNEDISALFTASEVSFEGTRYGADDLKAELDATMASTGRNYLVVSYKLDEGGFVKKIDLLEEMTYEDNGMTKNVIVGEKKYNAYDKTFGGMSNGAFGLDDEVYAICIPENDTDSLDDYLAKINMKHNQEYVVGAFKYNKDTHCPEVVVFNQEMHAKSSAVYNEKDIAVVRETFEHENEEGDVVKGAVMMTRDGLISAEYSDMTAESFAFESIRRGDIIKYSLDAKNRLDGFERYESVDPIPDDAYTNTLEKEIYVGTIADAEYRYVSDTLNKWVDSLYITGQGLSSKTYELPHSNTPAIFIYDTTKSRDERITLGTSDDFLSEQEKAVVISSYSTVRAVVIVK